MFMAKEIKSSHAKKLIERHRLVMSGLDKAKKNYLTLSKEVKTASEELINEGLTELLNDIPIEELNREKKGFRVKNLRERGYNSIGDVHRASAASLAAVNGISDEGAKEIKRIAKKILTQSRKGAKIRLSEDDKNPRSTKLIIALAKLSKIHSPSTQCIALAKDARDTVSEGITALTPATGGLKWFFAPSEKKNAAIAAYEKLTELIEGEYGQSAEENLKKLKKAVFINADEAWREFSKNSAEFFALLEIVNPGILGTDDVLYGLPEDLAAKIQEQPLELEGLQCTLRRYQEWGVKYILHQKRVLLGDEMGLGKTIQAIAAMVSLKNTGASHFMVVCPASVLSNWCREISKMSKLSVIKVHGASRENAVKEWIDQGGVAVTTYETTGYIALSKGFKFSMLVVDEAHYIKNHEAQRTANVKNISEFAQNILFMTGTALENNVDEMVSLIATLQPKVAASIKGMEALSSAPQFREKIAPVYYRRRRAEVLTELPELIENKDWCTMTKAEEAVYEAAVLGKRYAEARRVSWNVDDLSLSSKAARLAEIIEDAAEDGRKVIVFTFFLDTMEKLMRLLGERCYGPINGSVSPQRRQEIVDEFEKAPAGSVLAAQIQAGGTGLNIQSASVVIICEPQFKPSIENQAISRAYRMGQTRNVLVHRLLCEDSVDEKITEVLEQKQNVFNAFADSSVVAEESMELDNKSFGNIIEEEISRINAKRESAQ